MFAAGAANAATGVFTFATLFTLLRARSGVASAVETMASPLTAWAPLSHVPPLFAAILLGCAISAPLAYVVTKRLAHPFARFATRAPYARLARGVTIGLILAVFGLAGLLGLLILIASTAVGLGPPLLGIRRVHLMGCLLLPILAAAL